MARRDDALGMSGADTVIGTGVSVDGILSSEGDVVVDGKLHGEIKAAGNVTIGVNAQVQAPIEGNLVTVSGQLRGNITASGDVTITATGHLTGDVAASGLIIEAGGVFNGRSKVKSSPLAGEADSEA